MSNDSRIYSATYSNVPVYEFNCDGNHVMRRRSDDWINATHILKVAGLDKPSRTRVLEREVQKGVHEKVQGGYGKYQGTWIPLHDGRQLADRNGVLVKMLPIFDFVPGDRSPPPAPKHMTAPASKPRAPRQSGAARRKQGERSQKPVSGQQLAMNEPPKLPAKDVRIELHKLEEMHDTPSFLRGTETPDNVSMISESLIDEDVMATSFTGSRKRKRDMVTFQDQEHRMWADALLDYFMLLESAEGFPEPPSPPIGIDLDKPIDEKGHTAIHWAAAMGEPDIVKDLQQRGAALDSLSLNQETPLMRAVMYTNNFDKRMVGEPFVKMVRLLKDTVHHRDWFGCTVFHHIAATTSSKNKFLSARYYLDTIVNILSETLRAEQVTAILNAQDNNGDTAIMIAARNGARKCVRALLGRNVAVDIPNQAGETADDLIRELNRRRQARGARQASSSPFAPESRPNGHGSIVDAYRPMSASRYRSQTANTLASSIAPTINEQLEQLAIAYDMELREKEQENIETERVLQKRKAEVDALKQQIAELEALEQQQIALYGDEATQIAELERLERENEAMLELEQRIVLKELIAREEFKAQQEKKQHPNGTGPNGVEPDDMAEKLRVATELYKAQGERKALVQQLVKDMAAAGLGEKQAGYKKLLTIAFGCGEEDVEEMLPDILAQLEDEKARERIEAGAAGI